MKKLMFYCQHILGMGHLVRSMEIVRGLTKDFEVCFINGGQVVDDFNIPADVQVVNLPAIKTDSEFKELQVVDTTQNLEEIQEYRKLKLLKIFEQFQPDCLIIELFPFGRRRFSFELIPLLESVKAARKNTKVICSLRDIVVTKQDQARHEEKVCKLMNKYFDMLLIHGDSQFQKLEESFSRVSDLKCEVHYTGYVVQKTNNLSIKLSEDILEKPLILVSVGGGRFGHELLDCVVKTSTILQKRIPHQFLMFTGPFMPEEKYTQLQAMADGCKNIKIYRYTSNFLKYMEAADLSISMAGYNTTMNILTTKVRAMILPFTGNDDREQALRSQKLENLGIVDVIHASELIPDIFAEKVITCLNKQPNQIKIDLEGVIKTANFVNQVVEEKHVIASY